MPYQEPMFLPWDGRRVPLTFVGGYLGAGKTTVINEVVRHADRPIAVIVNDVGTIGVDARLIRRRHGDTIELTDGCVCCSSIEGLGAAFDRIRARPEPPDHVVVELSGVADPARMLPWGRSAGFVLDGLVVVVAADQLQPGALPAWIDEHLAAQVVAADLVVLTKVDLVDDHGDSARARLASLAPDAPVIVRDHSVSSGAGADTVARLVSLGGRRPGGTTEVPPATLFDAHETTTVPVPVGISVSGLRDLVDRVRREVRGRLVRAKGVVATADAGLVLVQVVGHRCEIEPLPEPEREPAGDLVVITLRERVA